LKGPAYERWVAGYDVDTGGAKGRLRTDERGLRFVEVVVNGPRTWSLAASQHPDVADAYDAAQEKAAREIIGWLAAHATTRVGARGRQVQVPVDRLEAAVVRHYTSWAGDPHRHLHLQVNARGYHLDPLSGEITELAANAGRFSARAAADRPEHRPVRGRVAGRASRAGARPAAASDVGPAGMGPGPLAARWREELHDLGFTPPPPDPHLGARLEGTALGRVDRRGPRSATPYSAPVTSNGGGASGSVPGGRTNPSPLTQPSGVSA
jgi:exodeoxyribonuclease V alpha subunit